MLLVLTRPAEDFTPFCFNGHPPLGVNATPPATRSSRSRAGGFNGHPPLGVNATGWNYPSGETVALVFQWAPTLGGECYIPQEMEVDMAHYKRFNGHPPLGVNATV